MNTVQRATRPSLAGEARRALSEPPWLYVVVATLLASLFLVTGLVTRAHRAERSRRAELAADHGARLADTGRYAEAVLAFRDALALSRDSLAWPVALAESLIALDRRAEAEAYLSDVLPRDPSNGLANLLMARVTAAEGRALEARVHYQRAIYGLWSDRPLQHRIDARLELVDLLRRTATRREVLAELLQLRADLPPDPDLQMRVAGLLREAGAPTEAADLYREVVAEHPGEVPALEGLARTEFERDNFTEARAAFRQAIAIDPENDALRQQLALCESVLALDPSLRRLTPGQRRWRSARLLSLAVAVVGRCVPAASGPPGLHQTLDEAATRLKPVRRRVDEEEVELDVTLAQRVWNARPSGCRGDSTEERAMPIVLRVLSR